MANAHIKDRPSSLQELTLLLMLLPLVGGGCSLRLPGREFSMGYAAERSGVDHRVVGGLDLRLGGGWPGFHAGLESTTVSTAPASANIRSGRPAASARFTPPLAWTWSRSGVVHHAGWFHRARHSPTGAVQFVGGSKLGLGATWHPAATSFDLGYSRQTLVIARPDAEGTFLIDFSSRRPLEGGLSRIQTNPNDTPAP